MLLVILVLTSISLVTAQRKRPPVKPKPKPIVFAVIGNGERIEPIGAIDKGKLVETIGGDGEAKSLLSFSQNYYKPKTTYNLIFGGAKNGTVTIVNSNPKSDCGKNAATVRTQSAKAKLKGLVMGLATNKTPVKRLPACVVCRRQPNAPKSRRWFAPNLPNKVFRKMR